MEGSTEGIELLSCWPPPDVPATGTNESDIVSSNVSSQRIRNMDGLSQGMKSGQNSKRNLKECEQHKQKKTKGNHFTYDTCDYLADVALARWWRRIGRDLCSNQKLGENVSPHTLLAHVVRFPQAREYLHGEIAKLELRARSGVGTMRWDVLGSFYERMGDFAKAYSCLLIAVKEGAGCATKWILERVFRQLRIETNQACALSRLKPPLFVFPPVQVERRAADTLSSEEFLYRYAMTRTPLVITGLATRLSQKQWTLEHIKDIAGKCSVTTKRFVPGSAEWAQLEQGPVMTVDAFIDRIQNHKYEEEQLYLFDWSLPLYCPNLANELKIPKYFAGDLLQQTTDGSLYKDSWPSLFVAPAGLTSQLHVDAFGSNFWMALFKGTKRWTFYEGINAPFLYPRYYHSLDPVFQADVTNPDLEMYPLLSLTHPREVVLKEGEILFVPAGSPHRVENLTETVAISANFVDLSNLELVKQELEAQALTDPRADDLLSQLQNLHIPSNIERNHLPYETFKGSKEFSTRN